MLRFLTAGESHGRALIATVEGLPAGIPIDDDYINVQMARRMHGYGRGGRMKIETDTAELMSGVIRGATIGSPVAFFIGNRDWRKDEPDVTRPRPGHTDLVGALKYGFDDVRRVLERSSARETAARVAAGAICRKLLEEFGVTIMSHVTEIGGEAIRARPERFEEIPALAEASAVRCVDAEASDRMRAAIKAAGQDSDTLGGIFEVWVFDPLPGLGSHVSGDARLDGRTGQAMLGVQAIKGVEIGAGFELGRIRGSAAHDEIFWSEDRGYHRRTNRSGGLEGGMTHGAPLVVRAAMKPIATLSRPLASVDVQSKEATAAFKERSDICAVPAAAVIGEAVIAFVLAQALIDKFGGDSIASLDAAVDRYRAVLAQ